MWIGTLSIAISTPTLPLLEATALTLFTSQNQSFTSLVKVDASVVLKYCIVPSTRMSPQELVVEVPSTLAFDEDFWIWSRLSSAAKIIGFAASTLTASVPR